MKNHGEFKVSNERKKNDLVNYLTKKYGSIVIQRQSITPDGNLFMYITYKVRDNIFEGCSY